MLFGLRVAGFGLRGDRGTNAKLPATVIRLLPEDCRARGVFYDPSYAS